MTSHVFGRNLITLFGWCSPLLDLGLLRSSIPNCDWMFEFFLFDLSEATHIRFLNSKLDLDISCLNTRTLWGGIGTTLPSLLFLTPEGVTVGSSPVAPPVKGGAEDFRALCSASSSKRSCKTWSIMRPNKVWSPVWTFLGWYCNLYWNASNKNLFLSWNHNIGNQAMSFGAYIVIVVH